MCVPRAGATLAIASQFQGRTALSEPSPARCEVVTPGLSGIVRAVHEHRRRMGELLRGLENAYQAASEAGVLDGDGHMTDVLERFSRDLRTSDGQLARLVARLESQCWTVGRQRQAIKPKGR
jgi:hypothetical protein